MEHKLVKQRVSFGKGKSARRKQLLLARVCNKKEINNDSDSSESNAGRSCLWWPYNYEI